MFPGRSDPSGGIRCLSKNMGAKDALNGTKRSSAIIPPCTANWKSLDAGAHQKDAGHIIMKLLNEKYGSPRNRSTEHNLTRAYIYFYFFNEDVSSAPRSRTDFVQSAFVFVF